MNIQDILNDKTMKPKEKTETISRCILDRKIDMHTLLAAAAAAKDPAKATCIEALEFATKQQPAVANKETFRFVTETLTAKAPRIKWESAKVTANTAHLFQNSLGDAIRNLLVNTEHEGTVVRWSAAFALAAILQLKTAHNKELLPAIEAVIKREEKSSIRKIYIEAVKKITK